MEPEHPEALGGSFQGVGTSSVDFRLRDNFFPPTPQSPRDTEFYFTALRVRTGQPCPVYDDYLGNELPLKHYVQEVIN